MREFQPLSSAVGASGEVGECGPGAEVLFGGMLRDDAELAQGAGRKVLDQWVVEVAWADGRSGARIRGSSRAGRMAGISRDGDIPFAECRCLVDGTERGGVRASADAQEPSVPVLLVQREPERYVDAVVPARVFVGIVTLQKSTAFVVGTSVPGSMDEVV
jgi:hypothetical protein